jgi:hypothetical protein
MLPSQYIKGDVWAVLGRLVWEWHWGLLGRCFQNSETFTSVHVTNMKALNIKHVYCRRC